MGDGLILTFDTVNKAVHCCVKMQQRAINIENLDLRIEDPSRRNFRKRQ